MNRYILWCESTALNIAQQSQMTYTQHTGMHTIRQLDSKSQHCSNRIWNIWHQPYHNWTTLLTRNSTITIGTTRKRNENWTCTPTFHNTQSQHIWQCSCYGKYIVWRHQATKTCFASQIVSQLYDAAHAQLNNHNWHHTQTESELNVYTDVSQHSITTHLTMFVLWQIHCMVASCNKDMLRITNRTETCIASKIETTRVFVSQCMVQ